MIKVNDISERGDLNVLLKVAKNIGGSSKWELRNLEYSGDKYEGMFPSEIEQLSKSGFELSANRFAIFVKSVHQIIEGCLVLKAEKLDGTNSSELLVVEIYDGGFWQIGGDHFEKILRNTNLEVLK